MAWVFCITRPLTGSWLPSNIARKFPLMSLVPRDPSVKHSQLTVRIFTQVCFSCSLCSSVLIKDALAFSPHILSTPSLHLCQPLLLHVQSLAFSACCFFPLLVSQDWRKQCLGCMQGRGSASILAMGVLNHETRSVVSCRAGLCWERAAGSTSPSAPDVEISV